MTLTNMPLEDLPIKAPMPLTRQELKTWRLAHGLKQYEAATILDMTVTNYNRMEKGKLAEIKPTVRLAIWTLSNLPQYQNVEPYSADELKSWRKALNLTQENAARLLGFTTDHLSRLESAKIKYDRPMEISKILTLACIAIEHQVQVRTPIKDRPKAGKSALENAAV